MESLMTQPGVPVLVFGDPAHGAVDVEQRRFFLNPGLTPKEAQTWTLPVCFQASHVGGACQLLAPRDSSLNVPTGEFFFPNAGGKGYYRMQFTPANFDALLAHAEGDLSGPERLLLAGNEWAEMRANQASVGNVLNLLAAMKSDPSGMLLNQVSEDLNTVIHQIATTEVQRRALGDWVRDTWGPQLKEMGDPAPSDSPSQRQLRAGLLTVVGSYGNDPAVLARARAIAEAYLASPESVDPTLARAALDVAAANGDGAFFDRLQKIYETGSNPDVQEAALRLLAQFERPELTERALAYSLSENVRNQDAGIQLRELLGNPVTRDLAWRYIKSHWTQVQAQFTAGSGGYVVAATGSFCSAEARDDVERFFAEHPVPNSSISLRTAKEKIEDCIELRTLQQPKLEQWLGTLTAR
jgi:aminopeptidase N